MKKSKFHSLLLRVAQGAALMSLTTLTLADDLLQIFTLAATNDAGIQQARARYGANHTLLDQQRAQLLPALAVNASSSRDTTGVDGTPAGGGVFAVTPHSFANGFNTKGYGVNLNQNLLNFQAWYQYKSARSGDDAAMATLIQSEQELIMRVASAYLDALRGQANLVSFEAEDEASQAVLAQTRQRYNAGLIPLTDVYDSQANADLASVNLLVARNDLKRRLKALEVITGQQHGPLETLSAEFPIAPATMSLQEWTETAVANNPQLQAAASELAASEDTARAARAALLPTLALNMGYNWNQSGNPFSFSQLPVERSNISVSFSMPVFAGGLNRSRMRQAYYTRDATESALLKARRDNDEAISNSFNSLETDVLAVAARAQSVISAQSALNATQVGEEVGTRNVVDVLMAQRTLFAAQREHANARFDYVMDTLSLKQAAGTLSPQDVIDLNSWLVP